MRRCSVDVAISTRVGVLGDVFVSAFITLCGCGSCWLFLYVQSRESLPQTPSRGSPAHSASAANTDKHNLLSVEDMHRQWRCGASAIVNIGYHQSGVQHEEVSSLSDVGGVNQVVVGVLVFAVSTLQSFNKLHQSLHWNLKIQAVGTRCTVCQL